ncbi:MAG: hypothetical protein ACK6AD_12690 [Cyanobacteriota bacterium]
MRLPHPLLPARLRPRLSPLLRHLPGAAGRRRALLVASGAGGVWLLRPWPPFQWLPGSVVGLLLLWAVVEGLRWLWWPRRWT